MTNLEALRDKVLLSFGTGERIAVRVLESRIGRPNARRSWYWRPAPANSERDPLTLNGHSNHNASSAAPRAADV